MSINVFFDLEAIPDQTEGALDEHIAQVEPPGNYKKPESIAKWIEENAEVKAMESWKRTALDGLYGEICSIAWAVEDGEIKSHTRIGRESEADLLQAFWEDLYAEIEGRKEHTVTIQWVGHNVIDFDLKFIRQRSMITGVPPFYRLPDRPSEWVYDTMREWAGYRGTVSLKNLQKGFRIACPDEYKDCADIDGSQVWDLYKDGLYDVIGLYNRYDVWVTREIYRKMNYE